MDVIDARTFVSERAWGARDLAAIDGATVRLHWTNAPYGWHVNDGAEVFVVVAGEVDMRFRRDGREESVRLTPGDVYVVHEGDEHAASPIGEARIIVIERAGSV